MIESVQSLPPPPPPLITESVPNFEAAVLVHSQAARASTTSINPATTFSHLDPFMENSYSEIPTYMTGDEALHIQNMNSRKNQYTERSYKYVKPGESIYDSTPQHKARVPTRHLKDTFADLNTSHPPGSPRRMNDTLDLGYYSVVKKPYHCNKQVTIHVMIMALAGTAYIGIGGLAGFYIGKQCKFYILS